MTKYDYDEYVDAKIDEYLENKMFFDCDEYIPSTCTVKRACGSSDTVDGLWMDANAECLEY